MPEKRGSWGGGGQNHEAIKGVGLQAKEKGRSVFQAVPTAGKRPGGPFTLLGKTASLSFRGKRERLPYLDS